MSLFRKHETASEEFPRWYERQHLPYAADLQMVKAYANWLRMIPWKVFGTFTFAWRVSDQQAEETFNEFINRLEHCLKGNVGYVRGDEKRLSGCGKPATGRHFHAVLTSSPPLSSTLVEELWMSMAGSQRGGAGALVETYDPTMNGIEYVLKFLNKADGNWAFRNLALFHPEAHNLQTMTPRQRRRVRRQDARQQKQGESKWTIL